MDERSFGMRGVVATAGILLAIMPGCAGPLHGRPDQELRQAVHDAVERELASAQQQPEQRKTARRDTTEELGLSPRVLEQLRQDYDPNGYLDDLVTEQTETDQPGPLAIVELMNDDLRGQPPQVVGVGLERAVRTAVEHNLTVELARFAPAISEADVVIAQAAFDWAFVSSLDWEDVDQPRASLPITGFGGGGVVLNANQSVSGSVGLERALLTGGEFSIRQQYTYLETRPTFFGSASTPNPSTAANLVVELDQPLLRGFGSQVGQAEIRVRQNAERRSVSQLRESLMQTTTSVEDAYWSLVSAHRDLVILTKLLQRGIEVRDDIRVRQILDADPAQVADAVATVERRRADVLRAQRALRAASDRLKVLMNDPRLPVGGNVVLVPTDSALDQPMEFSLLNAISTAIERRPDVQQAILAIDDASIRQMIARNARLPELDLQAQLSMLGLEDSADEATSDQFRREFIDNFILGLLLRQPLGNRAAEAGYRQARLERMQSVVAYRQAVQQAIADVKSALEDVVTDYQLIDQARTSRLASAEALRTLLVKKELEQGGYTVERLNLELTQQATLAAAERAEVQALVDYNRAIAQLHLATGTTLERNRINFIVPDANQLIDGESVIKQ